MNLSSIQRNISSQVTKTTLCFLVSNTNVLLALKKRGFGEGKWNGTGGKVLNNESIEEAAIRETQEEIGVTPTKMEQVALLTFYFPGNDNPIGEVEEASVFLVTQWEGDPHETEEMKPQWFQKEFLPYKQMWEDDVYWVPLVLDGEKIVGRFLFRKDFTLMKHEVKEENITPPRS